MSTAPPVADRFAEATRLYQQGRLAEAFRGYQAGLRADLAAGSAAPWSSEQMRAVESFAEIAIHARELEAADHLLRALALMISDRAGGPDFVHIKRALLMVDTGRPRAAYEVLASLAELRGLAEVEVSAAGLSRWERGLWRTVPTPVRVALLTRLYLLLGQIQAAKGMYTETLCCLRRGFELVPSTETAIRHSYCLSLAAANLEDGRVAECLAWLAKAEELGSADTAAAIRFESLRAQCLVLAGRYGETLKSLDQVIASADRWSFARPAAIARLNQARLLVLLNQTLAARARIDEVFSLAGGDPDLEARCHGVLALADARVHGVDAEFPSVTAFLGAHQPEESASAGDDDPHTPPREGDQETHASFLALFDERAMAVHWSLHDLQVDRAKAQLTHLRQLVEETDSPLILGRLAGLEGAVDLAAGDFAAARAALERACRHLQGRGLLPDLWQVERHLLRCLQAMGHPAAELGPLRARVENALNELAASFGENERRRIYLSNKWTERDDLLLSRLRRVTWMRAQANQTLWWRRPWIPWAYFKEIHDLLRLAENGIGRQDEAARPVSGRVSTLRRLVLRSPFQATLTFVVLPDRVIKIRESLLSIGIGVTPVARQGLHDSVTHWYGGLRLLHQSRALEAADQHRAQEKAQGALEDAKRLLDAVFDPDHLLGSLPWPVRRLVFQPDDVLRAFPVAALEVGKQPLPQRFSSSIGPPATRRRRSATRRALVAGFPGQPNRDGFLPYVEGELEEVEKSLTALGLEVERLLPAAKQDVLERLASVELVHLACHGRFEPEQPGASGLILQSHAGRDEVLTLAELAEAQLDGLRHATFSSCWAGDSLILPGNESLGIPGTLLAAGVESVLACLWPVFDQSGAELMAAFYRYLHRHGRAEALRRMQRDALQAWKAKESWAGFQLYGARSRLVPRRWWPFR